MAAQTPTRLHALLGLVQWGDIGPLTTYRSHRGKIVMFAKSWPDTPPTPRQIACRDSMAMCGQSWRGLTPANRAAWNQMARHLSLPGSGYSQWVSWRWAQGDWVLMTLERQSSISLESSANTPHVYDPRWRPIHTRRKNSWPDPGVFSFPLQARVAPGERSTVWAMPWDSRLQYFAPVPWDIAMSGPGAISCAPMRNQSFCPIWFDAPAAPAASAVHLGIYFPDAPPTLLRLPIVTSARLH